MSKIINFARAQVGKPYVFGRSGPDSYDCSGLTKRAGRQINLDLYHGATTQWIRGTATGPPEKYGYFDQTGPIETMPTDRVAFLFNQDKTAAKLTMAHTGLYDGAGRVIQAGGYGGKGVHEGAIDRRRWTHWATLTKKWEDLDMAGEDSFLLRRRDKGEAVRQLQSGLISLGYDLGRLGADGDFGQATETAVRKFQADNSLPVDAVWDAECQERMEERLAIVEEPVGGAETAFLQALVGIINDRLDELKA